MRNETGFHRRLQAGNRCVQRSGPFSGATVAPPRFTMKRILPVGIILLVFSLRSARRSSRRAEESRGRLKLGIKFTELQKYDLAIKSYRTAALAPSRRSSRTVLALRTARGATSKRRSSTTRANRAFAVGCQAISAGVFAPRVISASRIVTTPCRWPCDERSVENSRAKTLTLTR